MTAARTGRTGKWTVGPFATQTIGQRCRECGCYIPPGKTAWRSADGSVRCEAHKDMGGGE